MGNVHDICGSQECSSCGECDGKHCSRHDSCTSQECNSHEGCGHIVAAGMVAVAVRMQQP